MQGYKNLIKKILQKYSPKLLLKIRNFRKVDWEPELDLIPFLCDPQKLSIDIGANWGNYTSILLKYSKKCIAFEPIPELAEFLKKVFNSNVVVEQVALSNRHGEALLKIPENIFGLSTIEDENALEDYKNIVEIKTPLRKLDEYDFDTIGFIKIDVEGHEEDVLRGSEKILRKFHPNLLVECEERHKVNTIENISKFLEELDYNGYFFLHGRLRNIKEFNKQKYQNLSDFQNIRDNIKQGNYINNFIFLTKENLPKVSKFLIDL